MIDSERSGRAGESLDHLIITLAPEPPAVSDSLACMGDDDARRHAQREFSQTGSALEKICKLGELFATCAVPSTRETRTTFSAAHVRSRIRLALGAEGYQRLEAAIVKNCALYIEAAPKLFSHAFIRGEFVEEEEEKVFNPYLSKCPLHVQELLYDLYEKLGTEAVNKDAFSYLIRTVIPASGFPRGTVFLIEAGGQSLVSRLQIGVNTAVPGKQMPAQDADNILSPHYKASILGSDPIARAYRASNPLVETIMDGEEMRSYITGYLGTARRAGVLYLEVGNELLKDRAVYPTIIFKAVRQALNDCLRFE